jgi:hypothetical protein
MAQKTPKARTRGNVNIQVGQADNAQIAAGYEHVDATFGPKLDVNLGGRARKRKAPAPATNKPGPAPEQLAVFETLRDRFTLEEIETICWELGITFDDLPARTLTGKARQLVERATALNALDKLIAIVRRERPQAEQAGVL